ncbi:acetylglutamate kinase [Lederbergia galactosidilytica]|uniref:Acetylglutamate kinase n=1 Tax=Lederbergia galactosidilytica TaxID=217031 RepID=A0A0Q9XN96_9BACI|nr:acetylglutamate kinase [Lederbergia galactosidilytica]KRG09695.1 acetylglutamate kinase [Lederbergia galactosidilytica]KRG12061.1 acetylglutamate kinase [Virgibacillus soli]MBP1913527.1 acetylglutamate kinase [Lederbergia galactosidilytica]OAK72156.1 acetylglutamate kinase [Lederbergia galactosidilytica]
MEKIIVIKCGGSMIDDLSDKFFMDIKQMQENGFKPIIVHGGGPAINRLLENLQIQSEFINGLRKTTPEVMEVVEMVLSGSITNKLVRSMHTYGISAIGMTGSDSGLIQAEAKDFENLGLVGEVTTINRELLLKLLSMNLIPVISPIAISENSNEYYNVNADSAAAAIAVAMSAEKILFVTDVPGILKDQQVIETVSQNEVHSLIEEGVITGGMIPKVLAALKSLEGGMNRVMIVSGKSPLYKKGQFIGTTILKEQKVVSFG